MPKTVLVLAAAPLNSVRLHLGNEVKKIRHSLSSSKNRDQFLIVDNQSATLDDLQTYIVENRPTIVHFSGHGSGNKGLCFEDDKGNAVTASGEALAQLFHIFNEEVECIVLNACLSEAQAKEISQHIDYVIGMNSEIGDQAAIKFAEAFYRGIWGRMSYEQAHKLGCSAIQLAGIPQEHIPKILKSPRLGGETLAYSPETQRLENFLTEFANSAGDKKQAMSLQTLSGPSDVVPAKPTPLSITVTSTRKLPEDFIEVHCVLRSGLSAKDQIIYVKKIGEDYKVDIDATKGEWPLPPKTYISLGSNKPLIVRVEARLADYYNYGFDKDKYLSVEMDAIDGTNVSGYVLRYSELFDAIVRELHDGKSHRITVVIVPGKQSNRVAAIYKLVSSSWVVTNQAIAQTGLQPLNAINQAAPPSGT